MDLNPTETSLGKVQALLELSDMFIWNGFGCLRLVLWAANLLVQISEKKDLETQAACAALILRIMDRNPLGFNSEIYMQETILILKEAPSWFNGMMLEFAARYYDEKLKIFKFSSTDFDFSFTIKRILQNNIQTLHSLSLNLKDIFIHDTIGTLPNLRSLRIEFPKNSTSDGKIEFWNAISQMKNLKSLVISSLACFSLTKIFFPSPPLDLTNFSLSSFCLDISESFFNFCHFDKLESLNWNIRSGSFKEEEFENILNLISSMKRLKSFCFNANFFKESLCRKIFDVLKTLPSLQSLTSNCHSTANNWIVNQLINFLSVKQIKSLDVNLDSLTDISDEMFLLAFSSVESFIFQISTTFDEARIVGLLSRLRNLKKLTIRNHLSSSLPLSDIMNIIEMPNLTSITLNFNYSSYSEEEWKMIQKKFSDCKIQEFEFTAKKIEDKESKIFNKERVFSNLKYLFSE